MKKLPILLLAFNRPDHVKEAFEIIRTYKPERLYLECDGARADKNGEETLVAITRKTMLDAVDWTCQVKTLFREKNYGCAVAVYDAITWFLDNEEHGVIIEDDNIISIDFFKLCEDLLPRYEKEERIMSIVAQNHSGRSDINNTYVYTQSMYCWGWATWRRAWKKMDMEMKAAIAISPFYLIKRLGWFRGLMMYYYFISGYKKLPMFNSMATRWYLSILDNDGLVIVPGVNLAINIGMDGGTHYEKGDKNPYENLLIGKMEWPLQYNDSLKIDKKQTLCDSKDFYNVRMIGLKKKIKRLFK